MLHSTVTILLSFLIVSYACVQPLLIRKMLIYALTLSIPSYLLFSPGSWLFLVLEEIVFFFWRFHFRAKSQMMMQEIHTLWYMTSLASYQGGFHSSLQFVPLHALAYWLWLVYGGALLLLHAKWEDILARMSYLYRLYIGLTDTTLHLKGWLNNGNLLSHEEMSVLFTPSPYETYFKKQDIELVVMDTVDDIFVIHRYVCSAVIEGCHEYRVPVCYRNYVSLPLNCKVLLGMSMITPG